MIGFHLPAAERRPGTSGPHPHRVCETGPSTGNQGDGASRSHPSQDQTNGEIMSRDAALRAPGTAGATRGGSLGQAFRSHGQARPIADARPVGRQDCSHGGGTRVHGPGWLAASHHRPADLGHDDDDEESQKTRRRPWVWGSGGVSRSIPWEPVWVKAVAPWHGNNMTIRQEGRDTRCRWSDVGRPARPIARRQTQSRAPVGSAVKNPLVSSRRPYR